MNRLVVALCLVCRVALGEPQDPSQTEAIQVVSGVILTPKGDSVVVEQGAYLPHPKAVEVANELEVCRDNASRGSLLLAGATGVIILAFAGGFVLGRLVH